MNKVNQTKNLNRTVQKGGVRLRIVLLLIVTAFLLFFCQYLCCVPFNLHSGAFLTELMIFLLTLCFCVVYKGEKVENLRFTGKLVLPGIILALYLVAMLIGSPLLGGLNNYKNQSKIEEVDFAVIPAFDKTQVQLVDKDTAQQLGDRVFGTLGSDEVSQFEMGEDWVQISMNGNLCRVTPIDFGSLLKYFSTGSTPGYVIVDCNTGEAKLVRSEGLKYMKSAYFNRDLDRHLFFHDPFALTGDPKFELDDEGKPFWVVPVYRVTWVSKTRDVKGIYVVDPVSGSCTYYAKEDAPAWVDNVYPVSVIYDQFTQTKRYENGLINLSKKGVVEFTDDYAYVQFNDHVHIYTGVTSVGKDESNVGFAYVDLRSGEIDYIRRAGAEEYSARSSAEGALQQYHYSAIFPSMVNVQGRPTYFMGLVDGANLIKSYAFVNYENYQNVATGTTVEEAYRNYLKLYDEDGSISTGEGTEKTFTVKDIRTIVKDGNTLVLLLSETDEIYYYDISDGDLKASFIEIGAKVDVRVDENGRISSFLQIR